MRDAVRRHLDTEQAGVVIYRPQSASVVARSAAELRQELGIVADDPDCSDEGAAQMAADDER